MQALRPYFRVSQQERPSVKEQEVIAPLEVCLQLLKEVIAPRLGLLKWRNMAPSPSTHTM